MRNTSLLAFLALVLVAAPSFAGAPMVSTTFTPVPDDPGPLHDPAVRFTDPDLPQPYVVEEFFQEGEAEAFTYAETPVLGELQPFLPATPYKTRIVVRRPTDPAAFNGTVVIEWYNSTAGFDNAPVWDAAAHYFRREGIVYIGYTNANQSLEFLTGGCRPAGILPPTCSTRYADLSMPDDGQAYLIATQLARALKSGAAGGPLPGGYAVERVYHSGQSQQGGSMVTYASEFHEPGTNDGYFVQAASGARKLNGLPSCGSDGAPAYPECVPRLDVPDSLVATDLPVPVIRAMTETDVGRVLSGGTRQTDTDTFRYYEMAGTAHVTVHADVEPFNLGISLETFCLNPLNSLADGPVLGTVLHHAMWDNLERQVQSGAVPPQGDLIEEVAGVIARDADGNALGGIRVPEMDAPSATYTPNNEADPDLNPIIPQNLANLFCILIGSVDPFTPEKLTDLYPYEGVRVGLLAESADRLFDDGFLLTEDVPRVVPETPLAGRKLLLRDDATDPSKRSLKLSAKDKSVWSPQKDGLGDPTVTGALLRVENPDTGESAEVDLPAAGWKALGKTPGTKGYKWKDKTSTCSRVQWKPGRKLDVRCKGAGLDFTLDEASQGRVRVSLTLGAYSPWCAEFGGTVKKDVGTGAGRGEFKAQKAPAPGSCTE